MLDVSFGWCAGTEGLLGGCLGGNLVERGLLGNGSLDRKVRTMVCIYLLNSILQALMIFDASSEKYCYSTNISYNLSIAVIRQSKKPCRKISPAAIYLSLSWPPCSNNFRVLPRALESFATF